MTLIGKRYKSLASVVDLISYTVGGTDAIFRRKLPQFLKVGISLGMKLKAAHAWLCAELRFLLSAVQRLLPRR